MPRILTKEQTKKLETEGKKKFICVADISCDIDGGIELTSKASTIDKPCFYYNPISMTPSDK